MSSAVSIPSVDSGISNHRSLGFPQANPPAKSQQDATLETPPPIFTPDYHGKLFFDPGDGDITICVNGTYFEAHKYLIKKFSGLRSLLQRPSPNATLCLQGDTYIAKDMENTLKVLYATVLEGPFEFSHETLVSALRIATMYGYPELTTYSIQRLQQIELAAVDRIKIAREFGLASWEEPAYTELCERSEPITMEEANILGMDMFTKVVGIREDKQRRVIEQQEAELEVLKKEGSTRGGNCNCKAREGDEGSQKLAGKDTAQGSAPKVETKPSFVGSEPEQWTTSIVSMHLTVQDCTCKFAGYGGYCTLAPCAVAAFKNLQIQQISHAKSIADLQSSMDDLKAVHMPTLEPATVQPRPTLRVHEAVHHMLTTSQNRSPEVQGT